MRSTLAAGVHPFIVNTIGILSIAIGVALAQGCSGVSWSASAGAGEPADPVPRAEPNADTVWASATRTNRFLGHLTVKGMHADKRNLMTSIVVHPKLWETTPYILFDENGFGDAYDRTTPMNIDIAALRAEAQHDAETASVFWGGRPVHVMVNVEGWSLQQEASLIRARAGASRAAYNAKAAKVFSAIQEGIERGWPAVDHYGWWAKIVTSDTIERRDTKRDPDALNREAAPVWRRADYMAGHVYPFQRLVPDDRKPGRDQAHAHEWVQPAHEAVERMLKLREAIGGDQLVLPCMFGTSLGWRGAYKNQWMTEEERRLLVRAAYEAGADGIMVWQPIRSERERDEFQRAITHIEAELARINGDSDLGPSMTLGEMFRISTDWPGRPLNWMRRAGDQTLRSAPPLPASR